MASVPSSTTTSTAPPSSGPTKPSAPDHGEERNLSDGLKHGGISGGRIRDRSDGGIVTGAKDRNMTASFTPGRGLTVWMTGISGSGKTTIAFELEQQFPGQVYRLDGDNLRKGLNSDLGFSAEDRSENNRRTAEVAKLMNDSGLVVICALISPFASDRAVARGIHEKDGLDFMEVYIDAPLSVVEERDPKGLYKRVRSGEIKHFTGISSPYEAPEAPELHIRTDQMSIQDSVSRLLDAIEERRTAAERNEKSEDCGDDKCEKKSE